MADLDSGLAYDVARVYRVQQQYTALSQGLLQSMYIHSPYADDGGFLSSLAVWLDDIVVYEPQLVKMYDALLPKLDGALKE